MAVSNLNKIYSCGYGSSYALGHGNKRTLNRFKEIQYFSDLIENQVDKIAAGVSHSGCLIAGRVYIWGT